MIFLNIKCPNHCIGNQEWIDFYSYSDAGNSSLTDISHIGNLTNLNYLSIIGNAALTDLTGIGELSNLAGLSIYENNELQNLDGMEGLDTLGYFSLGTEGAAPIHDFGSPNLTDISGLDDITILGKVTIINNPKLAICESHPICHAASIDTLFVRDNAPGCSTLDEIDSGCIGWSITGGIFYDNNQNKIQDPEDAGIDGEIIQYSPGNNELLSGHDGLFHFHCEEGENYQMNWLQNDDWQLTTDSASFELTFEVGNPANHQNYFGLFPTFIKHQGITNISSNPPRCNSDVDFYLRYRNHGTYIEKTKTTFKYDALCTFQSASIVPDEVDLNNHTLTWYNETLHPYQHKDIIINLKLPDETSSGDTLLFHSELFRDSLGTNVISDQYEYTPIVLCSFDPNDKLVMPQGLRDEHYTLHDQKLTYTVRFQNTGNAEAIDIRILDTIDTDLNINTMRIVNSSFPVQTFVKDQAVEFYFNNIWLPDSTSNEPASHGFVTYEIWPNEGLDDYTEIENTAHIIFDFNPAIVTNTTKNTMVTMIPVGLEEVNVNQIHIHPNPTSDFVTISLSGNKKLDNIQLFNQLGQLVLQSSDSEFDVSHLPKGIYFVEVQVGEVVLVEKLIINK